MEEEKRIGERFKESREEKGLTSINLVDKLKDEDIEISTDRYLEYENGEVAEIPLTLIKAIGKILDVCPSYLIGWRDKKDRR
jgi:transcriptional regulator with XRE-family HTH domain